MILHIFSENCPFVIVALAFLVDFPAVIFEHFVSLFYLSADVKEFLWDAADVDTRTAKTPC